MDPVSKALAANSKESKIERLKGHRWQKGQSGNPAGRPKKNHITKIYERILAKPQNRKEIEAAFLKVITGGRMATVLMAREMAERTEGKVDENLNLNVTVLSDIISERRKRIASGDDRKS